MNQTITVRSSEKTIQDHIRRYYQLLSDQSPFLISTLFSSYLAMRPSLHKLADSPELDISSLNYAIARLPSIIGQVKKIVLVQHLDQLKNLSIDITNWPEYGSPGRRRQNFFHEPSSTLVSLIVSDSDLDDLVNCLIAYQIERQKFSQINISPGSKFGLSDDDYSRFVKLFPSFDSPQFTSFHQYQDISLQGFPSSPELSAQLISDWWDNVSRQSMVFDFTSAPIYFVSSNLHSLANIIGGHVNQQQDQIINFIEKKYPDIYSQWEQIKQGDNSLRVIDFLYYISSKYFRDNPQANINKQSHEESLGFRKIDLHSQFPCAVQIIPVSAIAKSIYRDPSLQIGDLSKLSNSKAYIVNIEYPLGFADYFLFHHILKKLSNLKGIYIIGKAAILAGKVGDVQIPNAIFDERTNNVFYPTNTFTEYFPFPSFRSDILTNQKAIAVYGTYLENEKQLNNYVDTGFNIIEMESGPLLTAIYQHQSGQDNTPQNVIAHIDNLPFDLGIINYASDNPLSQTLGDAVMSIRGVEPTYLASITTVQRIIDLESM